MRWHAIREMLVRAGKSAPLSWCAVASQSTFREANQMRLGLQINEFNWPGGDAALGPTLAETARRAEDAGFASFWVMDHFYQIGFVGEPDDPMLEAYSALTYAAAVTSRIKLGALVTGVTYRYPGVLVKQVTTLDVLSGGRAYLGIGASWNEEEHHDMGAPFPGLSERFERLEETVQIALQMWSGEVKPFESKHYHLPGPICRPLPLSKPHPPIMIGGGGEKKTLRLVAKYGDACNLHMTPDIPHKLEVLKAHCEAEQRSYDEIEKTVLMNLNLKRDKPNWDRVVDEAVGRFEEFANLGIDQVMLALPNVTDPQSFDALGEHLAPAAAAFAVAGR
jgi:F420-dependent oxidoreductase-like protein